ncbi:hypothetical protein [Streptomyces violens]|uniref:hypothetical protein n=1 Tax=Streptomyces violens TaxID=66377 RepID=UPI0004C10719|nr:hypothetical protein [Streptomyces violens]
MSAYRFARRRKAMITASAVAVVALAVPVLTGCGAVQTAMDCAQTATAVGKNVDELQQAFSGGAENPAEAQQALDKIDKNLDELGDQSDNADIGKAVDDLSRGVKDAQQSLDKGQTPDTAPIESAASELTKICTPG